MGEGVEEAENVFHPWMPVGLGTGQIALRVGEAMLESLELACRGIHPGKMTAQLRKAES